MVQVLESIKVAHLYILMLRITDEPSDHRVEQRLAGMAWRSVEKVGQT